MGLKDVRFFVNDRNEIVINPYRSHTTNLSAFFTVILYFSFLVLFYYGLYRLVKKYGNDLSFVSVCILLFGLEMIFFGGMFVVGLMGHFYNFSNSKENYLFFGSTILLSILLTSIILIINRIKHGGHNEHRWQRHEV